MQRAAWFPSRSQRRCYDWRDLSGTIGASPLVAERVSVGGRPPTTADWLLEALTRPMATLEPTEEQAHEREDPAFALDENIALLTERRRERDLPDPSIRGMADRFGMAESTFRRFLGLNPGTVRQSTLEAAAERSLTRSQVVPFGEHSVVYVDSFQFTRDTLRDLEVPDGATHFWVVYKPGPSGNYSRSKPTALNVTSAAQFVEDTGQFAANVARIVFWRP